MIKKHEQLRIHDLLDKGFSVTEVAERTGRSLGTIYKYKELNREIRGSLLELKEPAASIAPHINFLDPLIRNKSKKQTEIYFLLQQRGFKGARRDFEAYYQQKKAVFRPKRQLKHVETKPGEQAQVDWGHFGEITINGRREKIYLFAYILSWSRAIYMEFVVHQNQRTLQACHIHAFERLGIPKTIVYDNMKTVVNRRERLSDGTKKVHYNQSFLDFARYYQFEVVACPPYWPQAKGKVESSIKYVRQYFSRSTPKLNHTLEEYNEHLTQWIDQQAQQRVHGTTHEKPYERWLIEKENLTFPTNVPYYNLSPFRTYNTTQHGLLVRQGTTYNLGPTYARLKLEVREIQEHGLSSLEIYRRNVLIATLPIPSKKHSWVSAEQPAESAPLSKEISVDATRVPRKKRAYDIEVEQRGLDYYGISGLEGEVIYG